MSRRLPRRFVPLLLALGCGLKLASCGSEAPLEAGEEAARSGARRANAVRVLAAPVERREVVRFLETTTKIESELEITIHPKTIGIVTSVQAEEGDAVEAGDPLCVLDSRDQELAKRDAEVALLEARDAARQPDLDRAEAEARVVSTRRAYEQAKRDHERNVKLFEYEEVASPLSQQAIEASQLAMDTADSEHEQATIALQVVELAKERAETAVARAEVALERAEHSLSECTVRAPFSGTIAERSVRVGQNVGPADAVFVLTDTENIRAVFYRAQEELDLFRPRAVNGEGPPALLFEATTESIPGEVFRGRVQRVSPTIDRDSGQFRVTAVFDPPADPKARLLPGMLVRLRIATDRRAGALVVPKRAVRREGDVAHVLRIDDGGAVARVRVREGYEDGDYVEVLPEDGARLAERDLVVAVGSRDLEDGDHVEIEGEHAPDTDGETPGDGGAADPGDNVAEETHGAAATSAEASDAGGEASAEQAPAEEPNR